MLNWGIGALQQALLMRNRSQIGSAPNFC